MLIVFHLFTHVVLRYSDLDRLISGVSQRVLTKQLRGLERDGLVARTIHAEVPPKVEYRLTERGEALRPVLAELRNWGLAHGANRSTRRDPRGRRPAARVPA